MGELVMATSKFIIQGRFQFRAYELLGSVTRHLFGVANFYKPSLPRVQLKLNAFGDQCRLQNGAAELDVGEAEAQAGIHGVRSLKNKTASLQSPAPLIYLGGAERTEAGKMIEQNRHPVHEMAEEIELRQQNIDSLKMELDPVASLKAKLARHRPINGVLEIRELEFLSREEDNQSSGMSEEGVTENFGRQHSIAEEQLRKAHWMDGWSNPACMKAGIDLLGPGGLQSRANCGARDWSRNSAQGNDSKDKESRSELVAVLQNHLQQSITTDSTAYIKVLQMCSKQKDLVATKQDIQRVTIPNLH